MLISIGVGFDSLTQAQWANAASSQLQSESLAMNAVHPKKLLLTKWTAVKPIAKNKHFLVSKVIAPELPDAAVQWVDLEAVYSKHQIRIEWRVLRDTTQWKQGWV
jgi:tryptophan-rich hypothetical protein